MTLGERVRAVRKELLGGITQSEFAERLGVTRDTIGNIELDRLRKPEGSMPLLLLICSTFNVRKEWLLNEDGPMQFPEPETDTDIINDLLADTDDPVATGIKAIYKVYKELPDEDQEVLRRFIKSILDGRK